MYGFNISDGDFPYDNRPVAPLRDKSFSEWWFHNHLDHPPNPGDFFELPAGKTATAEIACNKGATSYFASADGGDIRNPNNPNDVCPGSPSLVYHTSGIDDLEGCALAIAYKSDVKTVNPEDFTIFSVNHTCVWTRFTEFQVPERMPPCPEGGCTCAFFWIHSPKSGGEESKRRYMVYHYRIPNQVIDYMNGFKCNVTSSTSSVPVAQSKIARRCGADTENDKSFSVPGNCTYGAKQPFYWLNDRNNVGFLPLFLKTQSNDNPSFKMFEGDHSPPVYNDRYNFLDGAQDDIFEDSYAVLPDPAPNAALPVLASISVSSSDPVPDLPSTTATPPDSSPVSPSTNSTSDPAPAPPSPGGNIDSNTNTTASPGGSQAGSTTKSCKFSPKSNLAARGLDSANWRAGSGSQRHARTSIFERSRKLRAGKRASLWHMF